MTVILQGPHFVPTVALPLQDLKRICVGFTETDVSSDLMVLCDTRLFLILQFALN